MNIHHKKNMRVVVIGAGAAGLAAGYTLSHHGLVPMLFEATHRLGGRIFTCYREQYTLELGAQLIYSHNKTALNLCKELGLTNNLTRFKATANIFHNGKLCKTFSVADSWRKRLSIFKLQLLILLQANRLHISRPEATLPFDEQSFAQYVLEQYGEELLDDLFHPFITSLVHSSPENVSAGCGLVYALCALGGSYTLRSGLGKLISKLGEKIDQVYLNTPVTKVVLENNKVTGVLVKENETEKFLACEAVVVAVPAFKAAGLLPDLPPHLRDFLARIQYSSCVHIIYGLRRPLMKHLYAIVIPEGAGLRAVSILEDANKHPDYAPAGAGLVHVFTHGTGAKELLAQTDMEIAESLKKEAQQILPDFPDDPLFWQVQRWPHSVCLFGPGQAHALNAFKKEVQSIKGLHFAGDYTKIPSVEGALCSGREAALEILGSRA